MLRAQHLANCQSGKQVVAFRQIDANIKIAQFSNWHEGDCEMQGAMITLNSNGNATFASQVCADYNHSKDIWYFYVELATDATTPTFLMEYS